MKHQLLQRVQAVQVRLQHQWLWECGSTGLFVGGVVGCLTAAVRLLTQGAFSWLWVMLAVVVPLLVGTGVACVRYRSLLAAARIIDGVCHLKDRTQTALQFLQSPANDSPLRRLQIRDAEFHLQQMDPAVAFPIHSPRLWNTGVILSAIAVMLAFVSRTSQPLLASPVTNPVVVEQALRASEQLQELEQFQKSQNDAELEKMLQELNQQVKELSQPGVEPKDALAKLSEMEAALQEMQQQLRDPSTEAQLKEIGEALSLAEAMASAGQAMSKGDLEKAAAELNRAEMPSLDRKTEKSISEKLQQIQNASDKTDQKQSLKEAVKKIQEGIASRDQQKFEEGAKGLAGECQAQGQKKKLSELLQKQTQHLAESKSQLEAESRTLAQGNRKGGEKAGKGRGGDPVGEKTAGLRTGEEIKLKGQESGTGDVDTETAIDSANEQEAVRQYRQNSKKYEALSESVLESESIPLGHRQTIRRYFELIRPHGPMTNDK
jgi:signal transduction histidine kinase